MRWGYSTVLFVGIRGNIDLERGSAGSCLAGHGTDYAGRCHERYSELQDADHGCSEIILESRLRYGYYCLL
ncbi:MAG: hypothetical protein ABL887_06665 [Nitrosomonas sp.]